MTKIVQSYDRLRALLDGSPLTRRTLLVGIDGPSGSGKSTIARALASDRHRVVQGDDFYRPSAERYWGRLDERPIAADFDLARLQAEVLAPLAKDQGARYQRYDWPSDRLGKWIELEPGGVVIIEGIYTTKRELSGYYDYRIWVECPRETRLRRGLERDGERARDTWENDWMKQEDHYVQTESPARRAHLVAFGGDQGGLDPATHVCVLEHPERGVS